MHDFDNGTLQLLYKAINIKSSRYIMICLDKYLSMLSHYHLVELNSVSICRADILLQLF